jgi:hypothetical protein
MTIHASTRTDWAQARLMAHLRGLSLSGSPTVSESDEPALHALSGPWLRVTFDELPPVHRGRFDATHTAYQMLMLMGVEVFYPHPTAEASPVGFRDHVRLSSEVRDALQFLRLDFQSYADPASPVTVADCVLSIQRVDVRRIPDTDGYRRRLVRATVDWIGRFEDAFS